MKLRKFVNWIIGAPSFVWLVVFYAIPMLLVFLIAFKPVDPYGGIGDGLTMKTWFDLRNPSYPSIIWRTLWQGVVSTAVCVALSIPISYQLSRMTSKLKNAFLLLIIVPFWTNFLIRIFAWKMFLHPNGAFKHLLVFLGLADQSTILLYNQWAVLVVMIYTYLPFAILPLYAAAEKFDFSLVEAALDLGAKPGRAFLRIFVPGVRAGIVSAVLMVLIPALGSYVIPDMVGGKDSEMIGNKIAQRVQNDRNLPHACALSAALMLFVMGPMVAYLFARRKGGRDGGRFSI
jgi:spermidine/putrescine transport system permease protein